MLIKEIKSYIHKNKLEGLFFIFTVSLGFTKFYGLSRLDFWKDWEISSFVFTSLYTIVIAIKMYRNNIFNDLGGNGAIKVFCISIIGSLFMLGIIANDFLHFFKIDWHRIIMFWGMSFIAMLFAYRNSYLFNHFDSKTATINDNGTKEKIELKFKYIELKESFRNSLFMSELPIAISFMILAFYSTIIICFQSGIGKELDSFFSGAAAFQMMCSNAVWIFTDDPILESYNKQ